MNVEFWDVQRRRRVGRVKQVDVASVAVSPVGQLVAIGLGDGTVRLIDAATRKLVGPPLRGHGAGTSVTTVEFSPDGRTLASGSQDTTIRLWDVATRRHLVTLTGHGHYLVRVAFSPDGKQLASIDDGEQLQTWSGALWTTSPGRLREVVCRSVGNNSLGRAEWRNLVGQRPYHRTCG